MQYIGPDGQSMSYEELKRQMDEEQAAKQVAQSADRYDQAQHLSSIYLGNSTQNADDQGRLVEATKMLGVDPARITGPLNPEILRAAEVTARQKVNSPEDWQQFTNDYPETANYLSNGKGMAVSWDDIHELSSSNKIINALSDGAELSDLEKRRAEIGNSLWASGQRPESLGDDTRTSLARMNNRIAELSSKYTNGDDYKWYNPATWNAANLAEGVAAMKNDFALAGASAVSGGLAGAAAGSLLGGAGAVPGAIAGAGQGLTAGFAYGMSSRAWGNSYLDAMTRTDAQGKPLNTDAAKLQAAMVGLGTAVIGAGQIGKLLSRLPGGEEVLQAFSRVAPEEVLANPVTTTAIWRNFTMNVLASTAEQSAFGAGLTGLDIAAQRTAEWVSGQSFDHIGGPPVWQQILKATEDQVPMALAMSIVPGVGKLSYDHIIKGRYEAQQAMLTGLADGALQSKTGNRSVDMLVTALQSMTGGKAVEDTFIPVGAWESYWQSKNPSVVDIAEKMASQLGVDPATYKEALGAGSDIKVPTSRAVAILGRTEHFKNLIPDMKFSEGDYTPREWDALRKQHEEELQSLQDVTEGKNVEQDSPAYKEALRIVQDAYPEITNKDTLSKYANVVYALASRAEDRGVLQARGIEGAMQALQNISVFRKEEPGASFGLKQSDRENPVAVDQKLLGGLFQGKDGPPRARIQMRPDGKSIIELYKGADYSSLVHEMMHHFTQLYNDATLTGKVSEEILHDNKAMRAFAGVEDGKAWTVANHEKLVDAFEQYLREGKAPSVELVGAFKKFKDWISRIYKSLRGYDFPISPEIRSVFDRMLASDEQIKSAQDFYRYGELSGKESLGLTDLKQYVSALDKSRENAEKALMRPIMETLTTKYKEEFKERQRVTEERVKEEVKTNPLYEASDTIAEDFKGKADTIAKRYLKDRMGDELERLHFEYLAESYGFASGDELAKRIVDEPNKKQFVEAEVKRRTEPIPSIESIKDEAAKAVHNEYQLEAVAIEAEMFSRLVEKKRDIEDYNKNLAITGDATKSNYPDQPLTELQKERIARRGQMKVQAAREVAKKLIESKELKDAGRWQKYFTAGRKSAQEATKAYNKGDFEAAARFKNQEVLSHALSIESVKAAKEIEKSVKYLNRFNKRGSDLMGMPHEFARQIDNILNRFGMLTREAAKPLEGNQTNTLSDFVKVMEDSYLFVDIAPSIMNEAFTKPSPTLTLGELRDLKGSVQSLYHVGRIFDKALSDDAKETMSERANLISGSIHNNIVNKRYKKDFAIGAPKMGVTAKIVDAIGKLPDTMNSTLVKMESFARFLDGNKDGGPMQKYILQPIYDGIYNYMNREAKMMKDFNKLLEDSGFTPSILAKMGEDKKSFSFLPGRELTMREILQIGLNWGNESNRDRIRRGYFLEDNQKGRKLEDHEIAALNVKVERILSELGPSHWQLIQNIWDHLDAYWPEIRKHEVDIAGTDPKRVEALPFTFLAKDGDKGKTVDLKGGYYPIAYDPGKSIEAYKRQEELSALYTSNPATRAMTRHGFTEARVNTVSRPVLLDWSVLTNHLRNVNYDLAMRKAVIDVNRLLNTPAVKEGVMQTLGVKTHAEMINWLKNIASDQSEAMGPIEKVLRGVRRNTTKAVLGFRLKALIDDLPTNVMQSIWQAGAMPTLSTLAEHWLNPAKFNATVGFINERSVMMKNRLTFLDRDIGEFSKRVFDDRNLSQSSEKFIYLLDGLADGAVTYPVWMKMYTNAIAEGISEKEAIARADGMVRRTFTDGSRAGVVGIQRGSEYKKAMTTFYSWYSGLFNRFWLASKTAQNEFGMGNKGAASAIMAKAVMFGWILPGIWGGLVNYGIANNTKNAPENKRDEERLASVASSVISQPFNTVPLLGAGVSYGVDKALGRYADLNLTPVQGSMAKVIDAAAVAPLQYLLEDHPKPGAEQALAEKELTGAAYLFGYPQRVNTWAFNFLDWVNQNGDATIQDLFTRRHKK